MSSSDFTPQKKYVRAIGPRLRVLLYVVFGLTAILGANSAYLASISLLERIRGIGYENYFYQWMFLAHLALGLLLIAPVLLFGIIHLRNARLRPNQRAVRMGYGLFAAVLLVLLSGLALMRLGAFTIKDVRLRAPIYWAHLIAPLFVVWLYWLHRLAGPRLKWRMGMAWLGAVVALVGALILLHLREPRRHPAGDVAVNEKRFGPSFARTATGGYIPSDKLMLDQYCQRCHQDTYQDWFHSAHRYSSFNNPVYAFSIRETRRLVQQRDGTMRAARFCAGCHDLVPLFSGAFDRADYDDVNDPTAQAGITCVSCHAISHVNSTRGNGDYTIEEPVLYPFTGSGNPILRYINETLVKARPEFHNRTFLKPVHQTAEFCSSCHKVHIPYEVNHYKPFLRGQNHYDEYLLSGASGHGARSFYYPDTAREKCAACHMPLHPSEDFGARAIGPASGDRKLSIHSHSFPAANTGVAALVHDETMLAADTAFLQTAARIDIFGLKEGGTINDPLTAPLRPTLPVLEPGRTYLLEVVVRTMGVGHPMTQGTTDSNEIWVAAKMTSGGEVLGQSGHVDEHGAVDRWAHFLNVYMLDKDGHRIDRRNAQDIFTPLYNHQVPPGAGHIVHYQFTVPPEQRTPLEFEVAIRYRKFDTVMLNYMADAQYKPGAPLRAANTLPVVTIASDRIVFPVRGASSAPVATASTIPRWQRWNDYGIGLLLEGDHGADKGELIQAASAFTEVEKLGRPDGPLNLARVYYKEGRLSEAITALQRAAKFDPPAPRWTLAWLNGQVSKLAGDLDQAIASYRSILEDRYPELEQRHFDFSKDYIVRNELGQTLVERAKTERRNPDRRRDLLRLAAQQFEESLRLDPENVTAHYNLALIHEALGERDVAQRHRTAYERYRVDDNAADRAIALARQRDKAADHAAEEIVIYPLQRPGAPGVATVP